MTDVPRGGPEPERGERDAGGSRLLMASGVGKSFWRNTVLRNAGLRVDEGAVTALMGRDGTGKTTLLRIAAGVLRPDCGTVAFRGRPHPRARLSRLAREGLFYVPDRGLFTGSRPLRWFLASAARRYADRDGPSWRDAARQHGVDGALDTGARHLSGGERRRAALALAELRRPVCLLADEPFRGIAPSDTEEVTRTLADLRERGCGVVVTGHEVPEILDLADRVIWLTRGTTHGLGTPEEARDHPHFVREYLDWARCGRRPTMAGE